MNVRNVLCGFFALASLSFAGNDCPFSQLSPERLQAVKRFGEHTDGARRLLLFSAANPEEQKDMIDTIATERLAHWGKFEEVSLIEALAQMALHSTAHREASRQALHHLTQVFHSGADPTWYGVAKIDHSPTGSGFSTGQTNAEFSRARAIDLACELAAQGLGGEYENSLLLNGLKEAQTGSAARPPGRGLEIDSARSGLKRLSAPESKFSEHLKARALALLRVLKE